MTLSDQLSELIAQEAELLRQKRLKALYEAHQPTVECQCPACLPIKEEKE